VCLADAGGARRFGLEPPNRPLQMDVTLAYARGHVAERQSVGRTGGTKALSELSKFIEMHQ
jgi:hypothetical protein